jgi:hypothetical protein
MSRKGGEREWRHTSAHTMGVSVVCATRGWAFQAEVGRISRGGGDLWGSENALREGNARGRDHGGAIRMQGEGASCIEGRKEALHGVARMTAGVEGHGPAAEAGPDHAEVGSVQMGGEGPTVGPEHTLVSRVRSVGGGAALPSHRPRGDGRCHGAPGPPSGADRGYG